MPPPDASAPKLPVLRVRHFVDGRSITSTGGQVFELRPHPVDHGRHGVPIASPEEVAELVARCSDGLARWMAIGVDRRRHILRLASAALHDHVMEFAEAYADDVGVSAVDTVTAAANTFDEMLSVLDAVPPSPLRPGIYVYMPSTQYAGRRFVPLLWPLLVGGSTLILHPQIDKPRIAQAYATLLSDAGLPDGVMNVIYGDGATTVALLSDPAIAGVLGVGPQEHANALTQVADAFGKRRLTELLTDPIGAET